MNLKADALDLQEQIVEWRRIFHQCPEFKMDTPVTSGKIVEILRQTGIEEIRMGIAEMVWRQSSTAQWRGNVWESAPTATDFQLKRKQGFLLPRQTETCMPAAMTSMLQWRLALPD